MIETTFTGLKVEKRDLRGMVGLSTLISNHDNKFKQV
jgi:hypothetical protein